MVSRLDRRDAVARLLADRGDLLLVTGLGSPSYDAFAAGDHDRTFYLWGAMGGALPMGLGLALARPDDAVLVLTGDGELLMGLGALATAGAKAPANLTVAVLDNRRYGETGMQASHTDKGVDLAGVAAACGFAWTTRIADAGGLGALRARLQARGGLGFAVIEVEADDPGRALPSRDGPYLKRRVRTALGVEIDVSPATR